MSAYLSTQGDEPGSGQGLPVLYNVVYCSRAAAMVDEAEVERILTTARRRNAEYGITGLLVFGQGIFFQWLEGPRDRLSELMGMIRTDRRHDQIILLSEVEEVRERLFPDWEMERVDGEQIREVLEDALGSAHDTKNLQALTQLLAQLDSDALAGLTAE